MIKPPKLAKNLSAWKTILNVSRNVTLNETHKTTRLFSPIVIISRRKGQGDIYISSTVTDFSRNCGPIGTEALNTIHVLRYEQSCQILNFCV